MRLLLIFALWLGFLAPSVGRAADIADLVAALAKPDDQSIEAIAAGGGAQGLIVLQALRDGTLALGPSDRILLTAGGALKDAATGDGVSLPPGTYAPIVIDTRLRGQLAALIEKLVPDTAAVAAKPADLPTLLRDLAARDFSAKIAAIEALMAFGDPLALPALSAMREGALYTSKDGALVIGRGPAAGLTLTDAATGQPAGSAPANSLDAVIVNNRLRGILDGAIAQFRLTAPDPKQRRAAAVALLQERTDATIALLRAALAKERDPGVREAMEIALAAASYGALDAAGKRAALDTLGASSDTTVMTVLRGIVTSETDPALKAAAEKKIADLEHRRWLLGLAQQLFQGISLGSVLLLAAMGLAITFGVMGVINMAHGEMVMIGAYTTFVVQILFREHLPGYLDWSLLIAIPAAFLVSGAIGVALERGVIRHLYGRPLETLLMTWGVSMILQQAVRSIFGPTNRDVQTPSWMTGAIELGGGIAITQNRIYIILFGIAVLIAVILITRYSSFGLQMRAVTQNRGMAAAMGIRTNRVDALTFGLGSGIAGMAGVALSQIDNVSPNLGQSYIVDSFMVVVFGGVGNLYGTLIGALLLGVTNKFLEPFAGAVLGKIVVLVAIILFIQRRPRGLFALKGRSVES
jgi:urea transport system permease protein